MSEVIRYDEAPAKRIHALAETAEMRAQRRRVIEMLVPRPGERVLDVGCGPGQLTRELAEAVGTTGHVCGVDVSEHMLALAAANGVRIVRAEGARLPLPECSFDAAVATQAYEFVEELPLALSELWRVLRPGGRALILDTDWHAIVWHSRDEQRMDRVLGGWRRCVAHPRLPRTLARKLREAGFAIRRREAYVIFDVTGQEGSYSAEQIHHLGSSARGVSPDDVAAWAADLRALARAGEYFFSLNRYVFLAERPAVAAGR